MTTRFTPAITWSPWGGALAIFAGSMLAGCASVEIPTTVDVTGMPNAELALQKSMTEVDAEMSRIGQWQPRVASVSPPDIVPGELDRVVSFEWSGPLDGAIEFACKDHRLHGGHPRAVERAASHDRGQQGPSEGL